jgi:hypothetical protein
MKHILLIAVLAIAAPLIANAQELKPLSVEDKAQVDELLKSFDPNSYNVQYQHTDAAGKLKTTKKGLANLRQRGTVIKRPGGEMAATNTNINIFKQAATNTNINIFKQAATNTNINLFKEANLQNKAQKLNEILQKYSN